MATTGRTCFLNASNFSRTFTAQHTMKVTSPHIQLGVLTPVLTKTGSTVRALHPKKILAFSLAQKEGREIIKGNFISEEAKKLNRQRKVSSSAAFESAIIISYCQRSCKSKLNEIIFQEGQLSICCNFQQLFTGNNGLSMLSLTSSSWSLFYKK